ncbi:MAG: Outer membrane protein 40 [Candidatus Ordinivivax streblomastigis]|uniref:Outer membrane protein 40 n=1 Tax=Candidatus Ordinivivax streblomastigis TaxID=2540710 RepID=A0A5M8P2E0_9BACT|nr:MAG: Outer membrane protein 40 [Candidatus Ordinivivax streblomastigis]
MVKNLFLTAVLLLSALSINAQNKLAVETQYPGDEKAQKEFQVASDKQFKDKTSAVRTTWVADRPGSNWFVSLKVGLSGLWSEDNINLVTPWDWVSDHHGFWHPSAGLAVGKWYSPVWGLRFDVDYGTVESFNEKAISNGGARFYAGTGNFLLNLKNLFLPYNPEGFFNPVLNIGTGLLNVDRKKGNVNNVAEKIGLQLNFRLNDAWDLFIDGQSWFLPKNFDNNEFGTFKNTDVVTTGTIGATYHFNYRHFIKAPFYDQDAIDALNQEINDLRNRPIPVCPPVVECPPAKVVTPSAKIELDPVFFSINCAIVRDNQLINVAKAAEYLLSHADAKLELASYADKNTGTAQYNLQLSKKRSDSVAKVLIEKFGIVKDRLILKYYGDTVQPFADNDANRVTIFVK